MKEQNPDFDRIARPYRLLEYLTLGRALERARFQFLRELSDARMTLVLGDGDGRFLARLLEVNHGVHATAVDISGEMLRLLKQRCAPFSGRLEAVETDALTFCRTGERRYSVVVTHFFLDCLKQSELEQLVRSLVPMLEPDARWVVSEFHIPQGGMRRPARVLVRGLYFVFRLLTGLRVTHLPDHAGALAAAGFVRIEHREGLGGLLISDLWRLETGPDVETIRTSH